MYLNKNTVKTRVIGSEPDKLSALHRERPRILITRHQQDNAGTIHPFTDNSSTMEGVNISAYIQNSQ
jgi:hypothetical protein